MYFALTVALKTFDILFSRGTPYKYIYIKKQVYTKIRYMNHFYIYSFNPRQFNNRIKKNFNTGIGIVKYLYTSSSLFFFQNLHPQRKKKFSDIFRLIKMCVLLTL